MGWIETTTPKTFTLQPEPPYLEIDFWQRGDDLYKCTQARTADEAFNESDWIPATPAEQAKSDAQSAKTDASEAKDDASDAKADAATAKTDAAQAVSKADDAKDTASAADTKADAAQSTAASASTAAGEAKADAQAAKDDASDAKTQAAAAQSAAIEAQTFYAASNTAAATAAKATASEVEGFVLKTGVCVRVKFTYANTNASPSLNFSSTGAKAMRLNGAAYAYWQAGATIDFVYDGTYWQVVNVPIYGASSTIGNPAGGNVYTDGDGISIRKGTTVFARWTASLLELGKDIATATIDLLNGLLKFAAHNENGQKFAQMTSNDNINIASSTGGVSITGLQSNGNLTVHGIGIVKSASSDPNALDIVASAETFDLFADNPKVNGRRIVTRHKPGDVVEGRWTGGGYATSGGRDINFTISLAGLEGIAENYAVSVSVPQAWIRQNGNYIAAGIELSPIISTVYETGIHCYWVIPTNIAAAANNDTVGLDIRYVITFL